MRVDFLELTSRLERVYSSRLALRALSLSDAWPLFDATRNPGFNQFLMWPQPEDAAAVLRRIDIISSAARQGRLAAMSAVVKRTGEWVSLYRFQPHAMDPSLIEMGLWTHDRFWRGRYSLELTRACVGAAFRLSNIPVLLAAAAPENLGSCRVLRSVGMRPVRMVTRLTETGSEATLQEFEITRHEWASGADREGSFDIFNPDLPPFTGAWNGPQREADSPAGLAQSESA